MDQMTMCNVRGVAYSDEPTENYHPILQFPSTLQSFIASFKLIVLVFWLATLTLLFWFTLTALIVLFSAAAGNCFL